MYVKMPMLLKDLFIIGSRTDPSHWSITCEADQGTCGRRDDGGRGCQDRIERFCQG